MKEPKMSVVFPPYLTRQHNTYDGDKKKETHLLNLMACATECRKQMAHLKRQI